MKVDDPAVTEFIRRVALHMGEELASQCMNVIQSLGNEHLNSMSHRDIIAAARERLSPDSGERARALASTPLRAEVGRCQQDDAATDHR